MSRDDHPSRRPYDWQAEEDLDAWREELAATYPTRNGGLFSDLDVAMMMLEVETARGYPKWVHD